MATAVLPPTPFAANLYWQQTPACPAQGAHSPGSGQTGEQSSILCCTSLHGHHRSEMCLSGWGAVGGENRGGPALVYVSRYRSGLSPRCGPSEPGPSTRLPQRLPRRLAVPLGPYGLHRPRLRGITHRGQGGGAVSGEDGGGQTLVVIVCLSGGSAPLHYPLSTRPPQRLPRRLDAQLGPADGSGTVLV